MSNKCLVTRLDVLIEDTSLLKIGEMRIKINKISDPTPAKQCIIFNTTASVELEIIGDGYFTDSNSEQNLGKSKVINGIVDPIYISNSDCELAIHNKKALSRIIFHDTYNNVYSYYDKFNKTLNLADVKFSTDFTDVTAVVSGDLSNLSNMTKVTRINLVDNGLYGDIASIKALSELQYLYFSISNITGYTDSLANLSNLVNVGIGETKIKGDISVFKNMPKLSRLDCTPYMSGNVDSLSSVSSLVSMYLNETALQGDLALMPPVFSLINGANNCSFTWSSRSSSSNIISITGSPKIDNIDKMLQDQAACVASSNSTKNITAKGTRTSSSDAAISTLQSKGYTVAITPA